MFITYLLSNVLFYQKNIIFQGNSVVEVIKEIQCLKGPFSLVYYNKQSNDLIFTRDRIGRNSLLLHKNDENIFISSVLGKCFKKIMCIEIK